MNSNEQSEREWIEKTGQNCKPRVQILPWLCYMEGRRVACNCFLKQNVCFAFKICSAQPERVARV